VVKRIIFDLDDTLLQTGQYYNRQLDLFANKVINNFPSAANKEKILSVYFEIDSKSIMEHGYDKAHFPQAMVKTWEHYCQQYHKSLEEEDIEECLDIGWEVYSTIPEPVNEMEKTMDQLYPDYELMLYTMGDSEVQFEKIRYYNLERWFTEIHVVPLKEIEYLAQIIGSYPPGETMIVGDSLRGEIRPALKLGLKAVHRLSNFPWGFHEVEVEEEYLEIRELPELFDILP